MVIVVNKEKNLNLEVKSYVRQSRNVSMYEINYFMHQFLNLLNHLFIVAQWQ